MVYYYFFSVFLSKLNYYFKVPHNLKVILKGAKITQNAMTEHL